MSDTPILFPVDGRTVDIRPARAVELIALRHRVLRFDLPRESASFPGDEDATSFHYGAFADGAAVCCATFHASDWAGRPAHQLRGMATDDKFRGRGLGRAVLVLAETDLLDALDHVQLWCNARECAIEFYKKMGWTIESDRFDIPTAGPHYKMTKRIVNDR